MSEQQDIIYIGDPQCSWCWGIAEEMKKVQAFARHHKINFTIMVGGLRVGGGQPWDDEFKNMIKHHWEQVTIRSGQKFGYELFDRPHFNYDTEPACRAVVAAKNIIAQHELENNLVLNFFVAIQQKFYVQSQDPTELSFYKSICSEVGIDFDEFTTAFTSDEIKQQTEAEFNITRNWGVTGYPTIVYSDGTQLYMISSGYQKSESIIENLKQLADL